MWLNYCFFRLLLLLLCSYVFLCIYICIALYLPLYLCLNLYSLWNFFWFVLNCFLKIVNQSFQHQHHLLHKIFCPDSFTPPPSFLIRGGLQFLLYFTFLIRIDWCFIDLLSFWKGENCGGKKSLCCTYLRTTIHLSLSVMLSCWSKQDNCYRTF